MTDAPPNDDDLVPVSVRLGEVVPPEDPEDWTRPLTWVAALGMLAGPIAAAAWFLVAPPVAGGAQLATYVVAALLAVGAAGTGATQIGTTRAWTATLGAGLFGALVIVALGAIMAGERQVGSASPTLEHAVTAVIGGLAGTVDAAIVAAVMAGVGSRLLRFLSGGLSGGVIAVIVVAVLSGAWG